jgi:hypothetical protein
VTFSETPDLLTDRSISSSLIEFPGGWVNLSFERRIPPLIRAEPCGPQTGGQSMKKVRLKVGDDTVEGTLVDFETLREEYNSYKLADGAIIRMKTVVTNIIRTEEFAPTGEPIYVVNSQNVLVADVPDELKKAGQLQ